MEPAVVEQTESCREGEGHRGNCSQGNDAPAVNRTEGAEEHGNVDTNQDCCHNNVRYILLDSVSPGLDVAILRIEEKGRSFCSLGPLIDGQLEVFFEAKICIFVDLTVPGLINVVRILGNFCLFEIIYASIFVGPIGIWLCSLIELRWLNACENTLDVQESLFLLVDFKISTTCLNLLKELLVQFVELQHVFVRTLLIYEV